MAKKVSKTGKLLCTQCRRLATGEGNVHRSNLKLACLTYCDRHREHVRDFKPLGYYSQHFAFLDEVCERADVNPTQPVKHPQQTEVMLPLIQVASQLLNDGLFTPSMIKIWIEGIAGQVGCLGYQARRSLLHLG